ncbi:MAG TPA: sigma 54-interacting transcriptional regulator [Polyangiaceae bacterium]|nr:sigma 54-interacting transcriptional regulator [Polyangiaceae bacterium]
MADRTVTEAAFDYPGGGKAANPVPGIVVASCRGTFPWIGHAAAPSVTVGRDASADFSVEDAGVSRVHARFDNRGSALFVTDLGSRNGTSVNGETIGKGGALAPPGSVVRLGKTLLVVLRDVSPYLRPRAVALKYPAIVGGAALDDTRIVVDTIARTKSPVLILGDTGTGKEVIASAMHDASGRSGNFVALNCAAVPNELVDAELFGHTRGAFSGAVGTRAGLFRTADGGTLFLDEIGELPAAVQAKLLRVLETDEVRAVGEDRATKVNVRIVAATNRDVDDLVETGDFRGDLLHRVSGLRILLPALRDRIEDVPALSHHFLRDAGIAVSAHALERLMLHAFPGNVRELRNVVQAASEVAKRQSHAEVEPTDVATVMTASLSRLGQPDAEAELSMRVAQALTDSQGNVAKAGALLGMSRSVLYETLRRLKLDAKSFRA